MEVLLGLRLNGVSLVSNAEMPGNTMGILSRRDTLAHRFPLGIRGLRVGNLKSGSSSDSHAPAAETLTSPDATFSVVVTRTKEWRPYGIQGNIYFCAAGSSARKHVSDYFTDDHGETMAYLKWNEERHGFVWSGKSAGDRLINPGTMGASNKPDAPDKE